MERLTSTPFGRRPPVLGLVAAVAHAQRASERAVDKWALFRDLTTARHAWGLTDRDLAVLNALLSFYPEVELADPAELIVFPSNAALSARAYGMAESTLRRHLATLVASGLVLRHDSPNGKRYAARDEDGTLVRAFGFDLAPLLAAAPAIASAAREARAAALGLKRLREEAVLALRDATKLFELAMGQGVANAEGSALARLTAIRCALRRKLTPDALAAVRDEAMDLRHEATAALATLAEPEKVNGTAADFERHIQISNPDFFESEPRSEKSKGADAAPRSDRYDNGHVLPLALVAAACPDLEVLAGEELRSWTMLLLAAYKAVPILGISPDAWTTARRHMGDVNAAIAVACILQRADGIRSPGGYLRALTQKASDGAFSPGPMVMSLWNSTRLHS